MDRRRVTLLATAGAVATLAVVLGTRSGEEPFAKAPDRRVQLRLDEYRVTPERIEVPQGRITIVASDVGRLAHNIAVVQYERPLAGRPERRYVRTRTAHPGDTVVAAVTLEPGRYRLICTIGNHDNLGQYGELRVLAPRR